MTTSDSVRVIILDDDINLGEMLRDYLSAICRCQVIHVHQVETFWQTVEQQEFDVLFLDYKLGPCTGLEILEQMEEHAVSIPTIMMTGEGSERVAVKAIQSGAIDYLIKGDTSFELFPALIEKALQYRQLQRSVRSSLEKISYQAALLDSVSDAVVVWDASGTITYWNRAAEQLTGLGSAEMVGQPASRVYFPLFQPTPVQEATSDSLVTRRLERPGAEPRWIHSQISQLSGGEWMDVARDITPIKEKQDALSRTQHLVQRILETLPNIIYILNLRDGKFSYISQKVLMVLGLTPEQLQGMQLDEVTALLHPDDRQRLTEHYAQLGSMQADDTAVIEYRLKHEDIAWRWMKSRETVFSRSDDGQPVEIIGVAEDVTLRKLMEIELRDRLSSEELILSISSKFIHLDSANARKDLIWAIESVTHLLGAESGSLFLPDGDRLLRKLHYQETLPHQLDVPTLPILLDKQSAQNLLDKMAFDEIIHVANFEELPQPMQEKYLRLLNFQRVRSLVISAMIHDEQVFGLLMFTTTRAPLQWKSEFDYLLRSFGRIFVKGYLQAQSDRALRESEDRYRKIVEEHQTELICRFQPDQVFTFANETFCAYHNRSREDLQGLKFTDLLLPEDIPAMQTALEQAAREDAPVKVEHRLTGLGREPVWLEWVLRPIFNPENKLLEIQGVGRDITDRKRMESQIQAAQSRLTQSARLSAIGQLASSVAHQIYNPLTTIIADAQILLLDLEKEHPGRESAQAIKEAGWRLQQVVEELMKFSQPASQTHERVALNDTIRKAVLLAEPHMLATSTGLAINLPPESPKITGNAGQLTDLWVNLLLALRAQTTDQRPDHIWIDGQVLEDGQIQILVSDDGPPIPADQLEAVFEPQLIPAGTGRGSGIELSLCREIIRQHQGSITLSSDENRTTFRITFPAELNYGNDEYLDR